MSDKKRWPRNLALAVATELGDLLMPFCERIIVAGSLRREKMEVGDVELLFIPRFEERQTGMFTPAPADLAQEKIGALLAGGKILKRPRGKGSFACWPNKKLAIHVATGMPVYLLSTTEKNWWVSLVIHTGSKENNLTLINGAIARRATLNAYGSGIAYHDGRKVDAVSEHHVFALCGVPYKEPRIR